tara:strand:- start:787 stop:5019 length:4233 start_codon:yes stop_codon:yes gene_type:complete
MLIKNINKNIQEALKAKEIALSRKEVGEITDAKKDAKSFPTFSDMASRSTFVRMVSNKKNLSNRVIQGGDLTTVATTTGEVNTGIKLRDTKFGIDAYKESDSEGIRPIAGLKDISVAYEGGYKAIRKATVNFSVGSMQDLKSLTPHFLIVGKTVLLDWGWVYKDPKLNRYRTFFEPDDKDVYQIDDAVFKNPMPKIFAANGSYDAIGGIISNFEYSLREDGGFDCTTYITSIGINLFDSYQVNKGSNIFQIIQKNTGTEKQIHTDSLINAVLNIDNIVKLGVGLEIGTGTMAARNEAIINSGGYFKTDTTDRTNLFANSIVYEDKSSRNKVVRTDTYVTWGWFEDNILSRYTSFVTDGSNDLVATVRSIENVIDGSGNIVTDDNGNPQFESVMIRNNPDYLVPKDLMSFILPGINFNFESVATQGVKVTANDGFFKIIKEFFKTSYTEHTIFNPKMVESLINANSDDRQKFPDPNNQYYGRLRNIIINTKEIKKAFNINIDKIESLNGQIYGSDVINPPSDVKAALRNLLNQLNENFHNFWSFEIVEDPFTKNIKVLDTKSTSKLNNTKYTVFKDKSNEVVIDGETGIGIFKFPSFTAGSVVKNQELSFKIPDSLAITAAYGSNKNSNSGISVDTTNERSELEPIFSHDGSTISHEDRKLNGMEKAFRVSDDDTHKVGNKDADPNEPITKDGSSLVINPNTNWWHKFSTSKTGGNVENPNKGDRSINTNKFSAEVEYLLNSFATEEQKRRNEELRKEIEDLENQMPGPKRGYTEAEKTKMSQITEAINEKTKEIVRDKFSQKYYHVAERQGEVGFSIKLFPAGEGIIRTKLFGYDAKSSAYQTNFLIPAELNLEIDGTGGITPGDVIHTDYIQEKYKKDINELGPRTFFQTFEITQKVDSSGWFTELGTKMRMNSNVLMDEAPKKRVDIEKKNDNSNDPKPPKTEKTESIKVEPPVPEGFQVAETGETTIFPAPLVYGCTDDTPGTNPDINGGLKTQGEQVWDDEDVYVGEFYGYRATNYNPKATVNQISETNLDNPCIYPPEVEIKLDEDFDDIDVELFDLEVPDKPENTSWEDDPEPYQTIVYGCSDPGALNYAGIGLDKDSLKDGSIKIIDTEETPCQYLEIEGFDLDDDGYIEEDYEDDKEIDYDPKIPIYDKDEEPVYTETIKLDKENDKTNNPEVVKIQQTVGAVEDPTPPTPKFNTGRCTPTELDNGGKDLYGYYDENDVFIEDSGIPNGFNSNSRYYCDPNGGKKRNKVKDVKSKMQKRVNEKTERLVLTPSSAPKELKDVFKGTANQNEIIYQYREDWRPLYREEGGPLKGNRGGVKKREALSFDDRKKYYHDHIEARNETGVSKVPIPKLSYSPDADIAKRGAGRSKYPQYNPGLTRTNRDTWWKEILGPNGTAQKPPLR